MSFQQGLSGLAGAAKYLDVVGHNIANASTVGFKSSQAQFSDVYAASLYGNSGLQTGIGAKLADVLQSFTQGNISATGNTLDLAITGEGFFQVSKNGEISYTRNGQFHIDSAGYIVDGSLSRLQGYAATNGVIAAAPGSDLRLTYTTGQPQVTDTITLSANMDASAATPAAFAATTPPTGYNHTTSVTVYDELGSEHTLSLYFRKDVAAGANMGWQMFAFMDGAATNLAVGAPGALTYPVATGQLTPATALHTVTGSYTVGGVAGTAFSIDMDLTGSSMFAGSFGVNTLTQNGYGKGELAGLEVTKDGLVNAQYTNGRSLTVGQLSLTSFINPNGLQSVGENHWIATLAAGTANTQQPNSGVLGVIQSGTVEESNVDLTAELVNLIIAQRMYQANAQTISAQNTILQTLVNLR